jgi:DNA repair exonuclease SbcCD ATPase subunit
VSVCPRCGTNIDNHIKTWPIVGKRAPTGEQLELKLGIFMCPECEKRFLKVLEKQVNERSLKGTIEEIKGIEKGLAVMLDDLKEKIERLKNERSKLIEEIDALKTEGEKRAGSLEDEIFSLRDEVEDLKKMLGESD